MSQDWPKVRLGDVLTRRMPDTQVSKDGVYQFAGVYCFGRGVFRGQLRKGTEFAYSALTKLRVGEFIYPKLMAWEGAFGLVPESCDGCFVSPEFPVFEISRDRLEPKFLDWMFKRPRMWEQIAGGSSGTNVRRQRLNPADFLDAKVAFPPVSEQRRIVAKIEEVSDQIEGARSLQSNIEEELSLLLLSAYTKLAEFAERRSLGEVAPLVRRQVCIDTASIYPQVAARSFGRGTFHKPALIGSEATWEKAFLVKQNDILVSNIKAWEGALAVAGPQDDGRYGSHRYLTFVPRESVATSNFICFHLLSRDGLHAVSEASPGSADRNRTLNTKLLLQAQVPVPPLAQQLWFDQLHAQVNAIKRQQAETSAELDALMPAILDKAFKGEL